MLINYVHNFLTFWNMKILQQLPLPLQHTFTKSIKVVGLPLFRHCKTLKSITVRLVMPLASVMSEDSISLIRLQRIAEYSTIYMWIYYSMRKMEAKYFEAEHPADSRSRQPACSTYVVWWGLRHPGSKPPVAPVTQRKVAASSSAQCWKLWPSSENYWTPSTWESRAMTPPVWPWFDAQRGVADVGTQQQTLVWPGCQRTVGETTTRWPDEDLAEEPSARPLVSDSTATTIRMAFKKPLSIA